MTLIVHVIVASSIIGPTSAPTFWDGYSNYNVSMFVIACVALLVSVVGFLIALRQISKTRKAAVAAQEASASTSERLVSLSAIVETSELCALASEVVQLLRSKERKAAALRAFDLRLGLAQLRFSDGGAPLLRNEAWQATITEIRGVQDALESSAGAGKDEKLILQKQVRTMSRIAEQMNELKAKAASLTGGA